MHCSVSKVSENSPGLVHVEGTSDSTGTTMSYYLLFFRIDYASVLVQSLKNNNELSLGRNIGLYFIPKKHFIKKLNWSSADLHQISCRLHTHYGIWWNERQNDSGVFIYLKMNKYFSDLIKQIKLPQQRTLAVKWLAWSLGDEPREDCPLREN